MQKVLIIFPSLLTGTISIPGCSFLEGRLPGCDREEKIYLILVLFELNDVPRTPTDGLSHPGADKYSF